MTNNLIPLLFASALLGCSSFSEKRTPAMSAPFSPVEQGSLFASYEPLEIELDAPLKVLFDKVKAAPFLLKKDITISGTLSYVNESNQSVKHAVEIHAKGFSTLVTCDFPKLELKITSKDREGSLFSSTKTVDLNTHCQEEDRAVAYPILKVSFYNHREAFVYRIAEILEIPTLKARPVFVRYRNTQDPSIENKEYRAFFLEDVGSFRKRLSAKEIKGVDDPLKFAALEKDPSKAAQYKFSNVKSASQVDPEDAARIALFQALIGNGDWFIKMHSNHYRGNDLADLNNLWNTKIVELPSGKWVLFPQDFSMAGILMGNPVNLLDKTSFEAISPAAQMRLKQAFFDRKAEVIAVVDGLSRDPEGPAVMKKTLENFYKIFEIER